MLAAVLGLAGPAAAGADDYPWRDPVRYPANRWDSWGYFYRQCTSFVAWRLHSRNGYEMPRAIGNANNWDNWFRARGVPVNGAPAVGAIAQTDAGRAGHVAWVEAVNSNGTVTIEEYNYARPQAYSERTVAAGSFVYIHVKDLTAARDLAYVKWAPTGSGRLELHTATATSAYRAFGLHVATPISATDTSGVFDMADVNADGRADLAYIKRRNTGSGRIEVHWLDAATGYSRFGGHHATPLSAAEDANGQFELADMSGDRRADLVYVKTRNTGSGRVELHWVDAASGFTRFGANLATGYSPADAGNGYFHVADTNADGRMDLAFVKIRNTGSGRIEVHWLDAATGYTRFGGHHATPLGGAERANGWFEATDMNADRRADLVFIKDYNTGSGRIEVHWLDAAAGFSRFGANHATVLSAAEAGHGFFTIT